MSISPRYRHLGIAILSVACMAAAGDAVLFKSKLARDAKAKRDAEIQRAEAAYEHAVAAANKQYDHDLDDAFKLALKNQDLDEATNIKREKEDLESNALLGHPAAGESVFTIVADGEWQDTAEVHKGDIVSIRASGKWSWDSTNPKAFTGPDGLGIGRPGSLLARLGDKSFTVGSKYTFTAPGDGMIQMGMQAHGEIGKGKNQGSLTIVIQIASPPR